jgi:hypothetical protein
MLAEPLAPPAARKLVQQIVAVGRVVFSRHALDEMANDRLSDGDAAAVLRGGIVEPAELERGSWRYRMRAGRVYVVVTFRSETELVVVTVWRVK